MNAPTVRGPAPRPCESCPYRLDAPSGLWDAAEYARLPDFDNETPFQPPGVFLCHQQNGRVCAGWAGCHDGAELLGLRIAEDTGMMTPDDVTATIEFQSPVPLFGSGAEAAAHGLAGIEQLGPDTQRLAAKLTRRQPGPAWNEVAELLGVMEPEVARITGALQVARFVYMNEIDLHDGMVARLAQVGIEVTAAEREVRLNAADRIDFLLRSGLGIEVKVQGTPGDVWRQLTRYAQHDRVRELLLVTTRARHMAGPTELEGKPVTVLLLRGGLR